jgi:hypothetical protein
LARFYFSYGEFVFATTFEMPSHCTMRRNWSLMPYTILRLLICWWYQFSK